MTAAAIFFMRFQGAEFPRVVMVCAWIDVAFLVLGAPRDIAWLLQRIG